MKKIILFLTVAFLVAGCFQKEKKENPGILVFSYRILEMEEFKFDNEQEAYCNIAKVLLNIPDTIVTYDAISNCIVHICIAENFIAAKFYKDQICVEMENGHIPRNEKQFRECYIGQIDLRGRGLNWKYSIKPYDFHFYKNGGLPAKVDVK